MRVDSSYKYVGLIVLVAIIAGLFLGYILMPQMSDVSGKNTEQMVSNSEVTSLPPSSDGKRTDVNAVMVESQSSTHFDKEESAELKRKAMIEARLKKATQNEKKMRNLLDDETKRAETMEFVRELLHNGIPRERLVALEALQWLGGRDSVDLLLPMLGEEEDLADTVDETLRNLIEESLYTDVRVMDKEDWLEVLKASGNEDGMNVYLTLLSAFPELDSVPVLIELFKSDSALNKKMAQEFLEFVAQGEPIPSVKDAEAWWKKWLADRGITEQDLKDYENAGKGENDATQGDGEGNDETKVEGGYVPSTQKPQE